MGTYVQAVTLAKRKRNSKSKQLCEGVRLREKARYPCSFNLLIWFGPEVQSSLREMLEGEGGLAFAQIPR
jgi:hypothetical protein